MPLRVAEINGWLRAVNRCFDCPHRKLKNADIHFPICEHNQIRMTQYEFSRTQDDFIPIWCPLPEKVYYAKEDLKIEMVTKLKTLDNEHRIIPDDLY